MRVNCIVTSAIIFFESGRIWEMLDVKFPRTWGISIHFLEDFHRIHTGIHIKTLHYRFVYIVFVSALMSSM